MAGIRFFGRDDGQELEAGTLVLRFHIPGETPEEDLIVENEDDMDEDIVADAACGYLERHEPGSIGYIFRVLSDDQSETVYRIRYSELKGNSWSRG